MRAVGFFTNNKLSRYSDTTKIDFSKLIKRYCHEHNHKLSKVFSPNPDISNEDESKEIESDQSIQIKSQRKILKNKYKVFTNEFDEIVNAQDLENEDKEPFQDLKYIIELRTFYVVY